MWGRNLDDVIVAAAARLAQEDVDATTACLSGQLQPLGLLRCAAASPQGVPSRSTAAAWLSPTSATVAFGRPV